MLKAIRGLRPTAIAATTLIVAAFAGLTSAGSAFADRAHELEPPTLNGDWAPLNRCPVDDPTMLAATGEESIALCIAEISPSGSMTFGNLTVPFKGTNHQYGVMVIQGTSSTIPPLGGVLDTEPVELSGGIQELICPSHGLHGRLIWRICGDANDRRRHADADAVTWTLESAGNLANFQLFAGLAPGVPIATVPLRIHLQNRYLGDDCYIGSEGEPIVTQPASLAQPEVEFLHFASNGTPNTEGQMLDIKSHGSQGSTGFTVPVASGCGRNGVLDRAIDDKVGLPSSTSTNSLIFNEGTTNLVGIDNPESVAPNDGKVLSEFWHAAVIAPEKSGHGHGHDNQQKGDRPGSTAEVEGYTRRKFGLDH